MVHLKQIRIQIKWQHNWRQHPGKLSKVKPSMEQRTYPQLLTSRGKVFILELPQLIYY